MAQSRKPFPQQNWLAGQSNYNKAGGAYLWARGIDYRTEPSQLTLLPQAVSETQLSDFGKWAEQVVGRTVTLGQTTNLIANGSFETNTTGWTLGADYTRDSTSSYLGSFAIKQASTSGSATLTTASGSGLAVSSYADYQLVFNVNLSLVSGKAPTLQILGGSLSGPNLLATPYNLADTASGWVQVALSFNAGQYSQVFIVITNSGGNVTAYYDNFTLNQISSVSTFALGSAGNLYKRYANATWVTLGTMANSHGNGLAYYGEDDFIYLAGDTTIGRYGPISAGTPTFVGDYLTSAGGVPTNTNSPLLVAANSDYFVKATPASALKITSDLSIEAFVKPVSLPTVGNSMTIAGLWKESLNQRAYKLDILGVSAFFGSGADGSLTISVNTTDSPIDSACSGNANTNQLFANNVSFASGQKILIIQMQGTGAGTKQVTTIQGYDSTNHILTTTDNLTISYNSSGNNAAQVLVLKQYTNVTVNNGVTLTAKAWNGATGGILAFLASGTLTVTGTISASGCGFRGASTPSGLNAQGKQGEGYNITAFNATSTAANSSGGGGGGAVSASGAGIGGGGGGNATIGGNGVSLGGAGTPPGTGGGVGGTNDLTTVVMGGGGGSGTNSYNSTTAGAGGIGGGFIFISSPTVTITGVVVASGSAGGDGSGHATGGGGGGAGGDILLNVQTASLGTGVTASGGSGGAGSDSHLAGGAGGTGRIVVNYLTSFSGTTTPTLNAMQNSTLVTTTTYQARLGISNDGTAFEYLTQNLQSLAIASWDRLQVSWAASTSTASFYENGNLIGTATGAKTAIFGSSAADFAVGANVVSSYANFFDGSINDVRVWNSQRTQAQFAAYNQVNLGGVATGLVGSWFLTSSGSDQTANGDNLVATGSPTPGYTTDVPYAGATTRGDIDQTGGGTGQTYTLPTSLSEAARQSFIPAVDPQKSLSVNINARGTGDWTLVVHNGLNQLQAQVTVVNASLPSSGVYEFVYPSVFTPVVGATYHFHLYSTVNDGSIKTTAAADMTTAQFTTFYQFLVSDADFHPMLQMGNLLAIGNGRYLAVLSASGGDQIGTYNLQGYNSRRLVFPAGWRVRSLAKWREYYAIGCWKGTTIKDFDQGIIFLWDGYSITYNMVIDIPEGGVNAMWGENGTLYIIAGHHGDILEFGGMNLMYGGDNAVKVKRIPKVGGANYIEVHPGSITYYDALLRIGVAFKSDSTTLERGVYTWGQRYQDDPKSLSFDYPISTGNRGTSVSIGALVPVGGSLLVCYQDNTSNGVNNINPANPVQTSGTIEGLITDFGNAWKNKQLLTVRADHLPLPTGANVDVKYKLNYEASWHNLGTSSQVVGDTKTRLPISAPVSGQYHVLQYGIDLYATASTPTIIESSHDSDMLVTETDENSQ